MDNIPAEILAEIFSFIPVRTESKSVFRLASKKVIWTSLFLVCKKWEKAATIFFNPSYNHNRTNNVSAVRKLLRDVRVKVDHELLNDILFDACKRDSFEIVPLLASHGTAEVTTVINECIINGSHRSLIALANQSKELATDVLLESWKERTKLELERPLALESIFAQVPVLQQIDKKNLDDLTIDTLHALRSNLTLILLQTYQQDDLQRLFLNIKFQQALKEADSAMRLFSDNSVVVILQMYNTIISN